MGRILGTTRNSARSKIRQLCLEEHQRPVHPPGTNHALKEVMPNGPEHGDDKPADKTKPPVTRGLNACKMPGCTRDRLPYYSHGRCQECQRKHLDAQLYEDDPRHGRRRKIGSEGIGSNGRSMISDE